VYSLPEFDPGGIRYGHIIGAASGTQYRAALGQHSQRLRVITRLPQTHTTSLSAAQAADLSVLTRLLDELDIHLGQRSSNPPGHGPGCVASFYKCCLQHFLLSIRILMYQRVAMNHATS